MRQDAESQGPPLWTGHWPHLLLHSSSLPAALWAAEFVRPSDKEGPETSAGPWTPDSQGTAPSHLLCFPSHPRACWWLVLSVSGRWLCSDQALFPFSYLAQGRIQ